MQIHGMKKTSTIINPSEIKQKEFDAVKFGREQKDKLSAELEKLTREEIIAYFKKVRLESRMKPSAYHLGFSSSLGFSNIC